MESRLSEMLPEQLGELSTLERRLANYLLKHEDRFMDMDITEIAENAGVSRATVVRFCKSLGFVGLKDFKISYEAGKSHYSTKLTKITKDLQPNDVMFILKSGIVKAVEKSLTEDTVSILLKLKDEIKNSKSVLFIYTERKAIVEKYTDSMRNIGIEARSKLASEAVKDGDIDRVAIFVACSGEIDGIGPYMKKYKEKGYKIASFTSNPKCWLAMNSDFMVPVFFEKILDNNKFVLYDFSLISMLELLTSLLVNDIA